MGEEENKPIAKIDQDDLILQAQIVAKELKEQLQLRKDLVEREERLYAMRVLGGKSEAGERPAINPVDEERDRVNKLLNGFRKI